MMTRWADRLLVDRKHRNRAGGRESPDTTVAPDVQHGISPTIHPDDEMMAFIAGIDQDAPLAHYLDSGARMVPALSDTLESVGHALDPDAAFLELACGHGRFTRHLVHHVDSSRVTVSDIHPGAVEFVVETFDVNGFVSVTDPGTLDHPGRYQTIFVASLFSHLPIHRWGSWARALLGLLAPGGVLVISTNGPPAPEVRDGLEEPEPGFWYGPENETASRLAPSEYGTTYVEESWARRTTGAVQRYLPASLWGHQDLYVLTSDPGSVIPVGDEVGGADQGGPDLS